MALSLDERREPRLAAAAGSRARAAAIALLVFVQIMLGAFVAGLKAGASYNTWPLMDGRLVPDGLGVMQPWYLNLFENALTVQFNHRLVAYALVLATIWHVRGRGARPRDPRARLHRRALAGGVLAQAALGIVTLLAQVPLSLGLAHQAGAAAVFGLAVWHLHAVRHPHLGSRARCMSGLVLVFDLDDTLYPERQFALSGFTAAGRWAEAELGDRGPRCRHDAPARRRAPRRAVQDGACRQAARPHARSTLPA